MLLGSVQGLCYAVSLGKKGSTWVGEGLVGHPRFPGNFCVCDTAATGKGFGGRCSQRLSGIFGDFCCKFSCMAMAC